MKNYSIDGLRRRPVKKVAGEVAKVVKPELGGGIKPTMRQPREMTQSSASQKKLKNSKKEIQDFLGEVKDFNPTVLVELDEKNEKEIKEQLGRDKKEKKPRKKRRVVLIVLGLLFLILAGGAIWFYAQGNALVSRVTGGGNLWDLVTSDPDTPLEVDLESGRTNVLVFGTPGYDINAPNYDGGWLTDTIMVASLDQETGDIKTLSLPRDLKVKTCTATGKINELYYCEYSKNTGTEESRQKQEKLGADNLRTEVEKILGINIQYFAHVNWQALVQVVDSVGGIDVVFVYQGAQWEGEEVAIETTDRRGLADTLKSNGRIYLNYPANKVIHLDGEQALAVSRVRNGYGGWGALGGNFSREQFQQKILQAVALKAKSTNFATDFMATLKIKDAVGDNLRMDFKDKEMKTLFGLAGKVDLGTMEAISLQDMDDGGGSLFSSGLLTNTTNIPCDTPGVNGCYNYVFPRAGATNYTQIQKYVKKKLSGGQAEENAEISVMNASSISGLAAKEKEGLEEVGLKVTKTSNAPKNLKLVVDTMIFKINDKNFSDTEKRLKKYYGNDVKITTEIPEELKSFAGDYVIIIGAK